MLVLGAGEALVVRVALAPGVDGLAVGAEQGGVVVLAAVGVHGELLDRGAGEQVGGVTGLILTAAGWPQRRMRPGHGAEPWPATAPGVHPDASCSPSWPNCTSGTTCSPGPRRRSRWRCRTPSASSSATPRTRSRASRSGWPGIAVTPAATACTPRPSAAAMELAGYLAVLPTLTAAEHAVTHQISTQYLRAARVGDRVRVHATLLRRTRALAFVSVTAHGGRRRPQRRARPGGRARPDHEVGRRVLISTSPRTNPIEAANKWPDRGEVREQAGPLGVEQRPAQHEHRPRRPCPPRQHHDDGREGRLRAVADPDVDRGADLVGIPARPDRREDHRHGQQRRADVPAEVDDGGPQRAASGLQPPQRAPDPEPQGDHGAGSSRGPLTIRALPTSAPRGWVPRLTTFVLAQAANASARSKTPSRHGRRAAPRGSRPSNDPRRRRTRPPRPRAGVLRSPHQPAVPGVERCQRTAPSS